MKALKKIKLNHYADEQLKEREMNLWRGGGDDDEKVCVCQNNNTANANANYEHGYTTLKDDQMCWINGYTAHKDFWT